MLNHTQWKQMLYFIVDGANITFETQINLLKKNQISVYHHIGKWDETPKDIQTRAHKPIIQSLQLWGSANEREYWRWTGQVQNIQFYWYRDFGNAQWLYYRGFCCSL